MACCCISAATFVSSGLLYAKIQVSMAFAIAVVMLHRICAACKVVFRWRVTASVTGGSAWQFPLVQPSCPFDPLRAAAQRGLGM